MHIFLFDIDGTILQTGGAGMVAFKLAFTEVFDIPEVTGQIAFAGRSDRAIVQDLFEAYDVPSTPENWQRFCRSYGEHVKWQLPLHAGEVLPGIVELLQALKDRGDVAIGLLTGNVRATAEQKLAHYGLWQHFHFGGFGDVHQDRNDIAATALAEARRHIEHRHIEKPPANNGTVVVLGDTPNDIRCARSIGAKVVAVATGQTPSEVLADDAPDVLLESLADAEPVLKLLDP